MLTSVVQRWADHRGVYKPADTTIAHHLYDVELIPDDRTAKAFVETHHYSASYPAARERVGLYCLGELVGVAVFSVPAQPKALDRLPGSRESSVELGRLVLLDRVPGNAESWMLRQAFRLLREIGYTGVLSFSDPIPRTLASGEVIFPGHIGTIYQALNATYVGLATPRTLRLLPDGTVLSARAMSKIRQRERGCSYAAGLLEKHGADRLREDEDAAAWLRRWQPRLTRPLRHTGNHTYLWALDKRLRKRLPMGQRYPKISIGA